MCCQDSNLSELSFLQDQKQASTTWTPDVVSLSSACSASLELLSDSYFEESWGCSTSVIDGCECLNQIYAVGKDQ